MVFYVLGTIPFQEQLKQTVEIDERVIDDTDWFSVEQIKSLKRNVKAPKVCDLFLIFILIFHFYFDLHENRIFYNLYMQFVHNR